MIIHLFKDHMLVLSTSLNKNMHLLKDRHAQMPTFSMHFSDSQAGCRPLSSAANDVSRNVLEAAIHCLKACHCKYAHPNICMHTAGSLRCVLISSLGGLALHG